MKTKKVNSKIIHAPNLIEFEKTLKEADNKTLVVFDIDEVIFTSQDQVLHPNYRQYRDDFMENLNKKYNTLEIKKLTSIIYKTRKRNIIDPNILKIFDLLQDKRIMTLGLTHCPTGLMDEDTKFEHLRILDLKKFGINFHAISPYQNELSISEMQSEHGSPLLYQGVVLTGLIEKGLVLEQILSKINLKPQKIIFIDDLIENLISVESISTKLGIEFIGFEYTAVKDTPLSEFNEERARLQFDVLVKERIWLSDTEADRRLIKVL